MPKTFKKKEAAARKVSPQKKPNNITMMQEVSTYESPTSVVTVPLDESSLYSTIAVSEHGAEVTLHQHNRHLSSVGLQFHTPSKSRPVLRDLNALLDLEVTPSPAKSPLRTVLEEHATPDSPKRMVPCCGANACWSPVKNVLRNDNNVSNIESKIFKFLSLQDHDAWQLWSYRCMDQVQEELVESSAPPSEPVKSNDLQEHVQRVLRNRAFHITERQDRLSALRRDLHPFHPSPSRHQGPALKKTLSYQPKNPAQHSKNHRSMENQLSFEERLRNTWYCTPSIEEVESPSFVRRPSNDELCYDSDPEDFTRRRATSKSGSRPSNKENDGIARAPSIDHDDDDVVQHAVEEFLNERWTLILHQDGPESSKPSHAVHAWIERGLRLYKSVITPRFVWKPINQEAKNVVEQRSEILYVELLEIQRILEVEQLDRERYPFAKASNSFMIKSGERMVVLEASSPTERDRLVRLLKLTVARLGTKLVTGDFALDEYFAFMEHGPGEEPTVLDKKKKSKNRAPRSIVL